MEVTSAYQGRVSQAEGSKKITVDTRGSSGWYDLTVTVPGTTWVRGFAGHLEDGRPSSSDPQLGR